MALIVGLQTGVVYAQGPDARALTIAESARLAATQNYRVITADLESAAREEERSARRSRFIPTLVLESDYSERASRSLTDGAATRMIGYKAGVNWDSAIGTHVSVAVSADDTIAGPANADHVGDLSFSLTQPLLKDGWSAGANRLPQQADLDAAIARATYRERLNQVLVEVESAYWELAFAESDVDIKRRSVQRAQQQYEDTRENISRGILATADIYVVEENLVFFQQQSVRALEALAVAKQRLAELLLLAPDAPLNASNTLEVTVVVPTARDAVTLALEKNPALQRQKLRLERNKIELAFAENQGLPTLDFETSLALNGLGAARPDPWGEVAGADRPDYRLGLKFEMPLSQSGNRATVRAADRRVEAQLAELRDAETGVRFDVHLQVTRLTARLQTLELASKRVKLAELKLEAQTDRYRNGIGTLDELVRFQRDLDSTRGSLRRAQVELLVARVRLWAAQGTLHERYGVEVK